MKSAIGLTLGIALALGLGGCKKEEAPTAAAGTKLLPRSVTDEMIAYDTIRSQAPLAAPEAIAAEDDGAARQGAGKSAAADENASATASASPSPTAESTSAE